MNYLKSVVEEFEFFNGNNCIQKAFIWVVAVYYGAALMMEVPGNSETSVKFYQTAWRNKPEDSHLQTRRREKPQMSRKIVVS
jgi:hypothetical protein